MIYTNKNCPKCGKMYEFMTPRNLKTYGCSRITCEYCNTTFITRNIVEPAILKPEKTKPSKIDRTDLFYIAVGVLFVYWGAHSANVIVPFAYILGAIFLCGGLFDFISNYLKYDKLYEEWEIGYQESMERLKDPEYARELKNAGFKVPDRFLSPEETGGN